MLANFNFLSNGGELGALMRAKNWAATALGPTEGWPTLLKTTVRILLSSRHPMFLWWGEGLIQFYNDAYAQTMGPERHPAALGQAGPACWEEIWDIIGPQIGAVMGGRGPTWNEDHLVPVTRYGKRADVWWTYSFSPIEDEYGVHGVLVVCNDVTVQHQSRVALEQMNSALTEQIRQRELAEQHEAAQNLQRIQAEQDLHVQRQAESGRLRALFEQAHGFMAIVRGPHHVFEFANAAYLTLVGQRALIGKPLREALPEIEGQFFFELLDQVYQSGESFKAVDQQVTLRQPDGRLHQAYLDFVYQPIRLAGAIDGIFVQGYDTTERALARQAVERSELRLRQGMKAAGMVVWDWDLVTNQVEFSDNAPELFGATWSDVSAVWNAIDQDDMVRL